MTQQLQFSQAFADDCFLKALPSCSAKVHVSSHRHASGPGNPHIGNEWWHVWNWTKARRILRVGRACGLAISLYGAGYAAGMHNYAADPAGARKRQADKVLQSIGAMDSDGNVKLCHMDSEETVFVRKIFPRVLRAAREEVQHLEEELSRQTDDQDQIHRIQRARAQLEAWKDDGYLVVDVNTPNAFVHALVPRLIFVQRGLFWSERLSPPVSVQMGQFPLQSTVAFYEKGRYKAGTVMAQDANGEHVTLCCKDGSTRQIQIKDLSLVTRQKGVVESDEQLAMILGHELSHVIHDHAEDTLSWPMCIPKQSISFSASCTGPQQRQLPYFTV